MLRMKLASGAASLALLLAATGSVVHAQGNGQGNQNGQGQNGQGNQNGQGQNGQGQNGQGNQNGGWNPAATPELDSSVLTSVGLVGLAGFAALQRRRKVRSEKDPGISE